MTVAFDWNGTLVDDAYRAFVATRRIARELGGRDLMWLEFTRSFQLPLTSYFAALGIRGDRRRKAVTKWDEFMSAQPVREAHAASFTLRTLRDRGVKVGIVSAARVCVESDLAELGLDGLIDFKLTGVQRKRDALRSLSGASWLAYVGDTEYDVREARAAGAYSVAYSRGYRSRSCLASASPDAIIDDLATLPDLIRPQSASSRPVSERAESSKPQVARDVGRGTNHQTGS